MIRHNFDVVCVGNAKIDAFLAIHKANDCLRLNKDSNELCIKSGEKIAVDECVLSLGGNAANVSVGLSRLGLKSSIYAEIGDDELSQKIINTLKKEGVDVANVKQSKGQETSISIILNFKNERTIFSEHVYRSHDFNLDSLSTKWVYLTSIGKEWKNAYTKVADFVKQTKTKLAFNPGTLQLQSGYNSITHVLSVADILFVNKEEAVKIMNYESRIMNQEENKKTVKLLLEKLQKLGPKIVVITDGKNGSFAIDDKGNISKKGIVATEVVEKTGAGDAYSSGFLSALINNKSITDAMEWGARNSASVIEKVGAQAGLLTISKLKSQISKLQLKS